jgi:arylsulfatase A-like enzyme
MGRKILFITTDQQRFDTIGVNGGLYSRTPNIDQLARTGINYTRAQPSSVVCMPSRASMLTGQFPSTHGAWMNGVPLAVNAPSVAAELHDHGYKTSLIGKAHFEPFLDVFGRYTENALANLGIPTIEQPWFDGRMGVHRGFDHLEFATHGIAGNLHYAKWMQQNHFDAIGGFYQVLDADLNVNAAGGGDTGAPQVQINPVARDLYHTDWVADRTIAWLDTLATDDDFFCWMSFPDPHHPWDPPASELHRVNWREVDLPEGYIADAAQREAVIDQKARHWREWYDGRVVSNYEAPAKFVPANLTPDQIREVNAMNAIEVELIDEAIGRVLAAVAARGWTDDIDIIFTTDHGEFQGDFGLLFKGPYHVDSLMRLPLIWKPAPSAGIAPAVVREPVSLVSLAATFLTISGHNAPYWVEGQALPVSSADAEDRGFEATITEWDSVLFGVAVHVRSVVTTEYLYTEYLSGAMHDGTEGELYVLNDDPLQHSNRFSDPAFAAVRRELSARLRAHAERPNERATPGVLVAPV